MRLRHSDGVVYFAEVVDEATARLWTGPPWRDGEPTRRLVPRSRCRRLVPVTPSKIVGLGRTYARHAAELGNEPPAEPVLFLKPPSSLLAHEAPIVLPPESQRVDYEGEIGLVVGRRLRRASVAEAEGAIAGVCCVNDVTARDLQRRDVQFTRAKGFDTFCPVGPWVETEPPSGPLRVRTWLDGRCVQDGSTEQMSWSLPELLAWISTVMTLEPGDLVCTGTPPGVGPLSAGQLVEVEVAGVGRLANPVVAEGHPTTEAPEPEPLGN